MIDSEKVLSATLLYCSPEALHCNMYDDSAPRLLASPLASWAVGSTVYETLTLRPFLHPKPAHTLDRDEVKVALQMKANFAQWVCPFVACQLN